MSRCSIRLVYDVDADDASRSGVLGSVRKRTWPRAPFAQTAANTGRTSVVRADGGGRPDHHEYQPVDGQRLDEGRNDESAVRGRAAVDPSPRIYSLQSASPLSHARRGLFATSRVEREGARRERKDAAGRRNVEASNRRSRL